METYKLFSTLEKEKAIKYILAHPKQEFSVRNLAKELNLSPAHISRVLNQLNKYNILKKSKVNLQNPFTRTLKILFNIKALQKARCISSAKKVESLIGIGIYGSWAKGTNTAKSDLDIWIKLSKPVSELEIAKLSSYISDKLKTEVSILALAPKKTEQLKRDTLFYHSLVYSSIVLWGEPID